MAENTKIPAIRFAGFTEAWEQRKLSELTENIDTGKSKFVSKDSGNYEILGSTSVIGFDDSYDYEGDFLLTARVGANAGNLYRHAGKVKISDNTVFIQGSHIDFLYYLLEKFDSKRLSFGTGQPLVKASELRVLSLKVPSDDQEKDVIGDYFKRLDNLITLHQRKYEKFTNVKKSMLEKMFPKNGSNVPEIRFKGFTEAWEQCKLSDLVDVIDGDRGKNYPIESDFDISGHTLFLNASNVTTDGFAFDNNQFISEEKSNSMGNGKLNEDDIIITSRGSLGHIAWYNAYIQCIVPYARINSGMLILRKKKSVSTSYLHQFLKSEKGQNKISFMSFGSAQPQLTKKGVEGLLVNYPGSLNEQDKLGEYFANLDYLITLHQRKLEKLKNIKKSMLEKMFI